MSGPCTNTLGPVRRCRPPASRAVLQARQAQPGRGIVAAPPEPRISTRTLRSYADYWIAVSQFVEGVGPGPPMHTSVPPPALIVSLPAPPTMQSDCPPPIMVVVARGSDDRGLRHPTRRASDSPNGREIQRGALCRLEAVRRLRERPDRGPRCGRDRHPRSGRSRGRAEDDHDEEDDPRDRCRRFIVRGRGRPEAHRAPLRARGGIDTRRSRRRRGRRRRRSRPHGARRGRRHRQRASALRSRPDR